MEGFDEGKKKSPLFLQLWDSSARSFQKCKTERDKHVSPDGSQESGNVARVRRLQWKKRACQLRICDSNKPS